MRFPLIHALKTSLLASGLTLLSSAAAEATQTIKTGAHPEDLKLCRSIKGSALITGTWTDKQGQGRLEVWPLAAAARGAQEAFQVWPLVQPSGARWNKAVFTPLGLSVVDRSQATGWEGKSLVYVINTMGQSKERCLEVFEIGSSSFIHLCTLGTASQPILGDANSIVALPSGHVFVSNFGKQPWARQRDLQSRSVNEGVASANALISFHPTGAAGEGTWRQEAQLGGGLNGLGFDESRQCLLAALYFRSQVLVIPWSAKEAKLDLRQLTTINLPGHPDNLSPLPDGRWMAACSRNWFVMGLDLSLASMGGPLLAKRNCFACEFTLSAPSELKRYPIPSAARLPSTVFQLDGSFYAAQIIHPGIVRWPGR